MSPIDDQWPTAPTRADPGLGNSAAAGLTFRVSLREHLEISPTHISDRPETADMFGQCWQVEGAVP